MISRNSLFAAAAVLCLSFAGCAASTPAETTQNEKEKTTEQAKVETSTETVKSNEVKADSSTQVAKESTEMTVEKAFEEAGFTVTKQSEEGNQTNYVLDIDGYQIEMNTVKFDNKGQASEYYESVKAERESGDASMIVNRSKSAGLSLEYTNGFGGDTKGMVVVVYETKTVYDLPSIPKAYLTEVQDGFKNLGFGI